MSTGKVLSVAFAALAVILAAFTCLGTAAHAATAPPATSLGVWAGSPGSVPAGASPDVLNEYLYWNTPFPSSLVSTAASRGATAFVEIEPWQGGGPSDCSADFSSIASGGGAQVLYEKSLGSAVKAAGKPVIFTFAHEFNVSGQYPWALGNGCGVTPASWTAAWKSVVTNVRSTAGGLAFFMWAPNADTGGSTQDPAAWWPGAAYTDMTGVDGYPSADFASSFGKTFSEIAALPGFSTLPQRKIFISETQLAPLGTGIPAFIAAMCKAGGDGVLEFEDGNQAMSTSQWRDTEGALKADCGAAGPLPVAGTTVNAASTPAPVTTPSAPAGGQPQGPPRHRHWSFGTGAGRWRDCQ